MPPDFSGDKLTLFLFAVLPGLIAIQVYNLCSPPQKKELTSQILEAVSYSIINMVIWWSWIAQLYKSKIEDIPFYAPLVICLLSPIVLAYSWYWLRTGWLHRLLRLDHPTPKGWDYFIRRHHHFWVLFHLKNGKRFGGYFGDNSYSSTFPHDPELYVEQVWRVDERGEFIEMVDRTIGSVVRQSDCELIEFFSPSGESEDEPEQQRNDGKVSNLVGGTERTANASPIVRDNAENSSGQTSKQSA